MPNELNAVFIAETVQQFEYYKLLSERAMQQLSDTELHVVIGHHDSGNSVAIILQHMSGNMFSRWTNFLVSDGEKPNRHRDTEFIDAGLSRQELFGKWETGWHCLFTALKELSADDLQKTVRIRHQELGVVAAIQRQLAHQAGHAMQIVLLAKILRGQNWQSLSIPRGQSEMFNAAMQRKSKEKDTK